jgi:hypothetical protein
VLAALAGCGVRQSETLAITAADTVKRRDAIIKNLSNRSPS